VKLKRCDVIRPGHIEHLVGTGEDPAQAGPRQCEGDTPASRRRFYQNAAEVVTSRSFLTRLIRRQLGNPAVGDQLSIRLGDEHLTAVIGDVRGELLFAVTGLHSEDAHGKLDGSRDIRLCQRLDPHGVLSHAIGWLRQP
jgi:hypothetical protein